MKVKPLLGCALMAAAFPLHAADFLFSFDTTTSGTGPVSFTVTTNNGFPDTPLFTRGGSIFTPDSAGGASSFTDFSGTTWLGSGASGLPGHSAGFNPGSVGNAFAVTFSTIGLENISLRFDVRSATAAGGTPPTMFTSFGYDLGSGLVEIPGHDLTFLANNTFRVWTADLSGLDAIENQPSVKLRWAFEDLGSSPQESVRIDNIQVSAIAVPEPGTFVLIGIGTLLFAVASRRSRR